MLPLVAGGSLSNIFFSALILDNQFGLLSSMAGALWAWMSALLFAFALRVFCKRRRGEWALVPAACLIGSSTILICVAALLLRGWPLLFFSRNNRCSLIVLGIVSSLVLG